MIRLLGTAVFLWLATLAPAQKNAAYRARLSPVAMDATMRLTVAGEGSATAQLSGHRLEITGEFKGLLSPATTAQLHLSPVMGVRGPSFQELTITKAANGEFSGSCELSADQLDSLRKGKIYILISSEKAPDGNLWGWLLP